MENNKQYACPCCGKENMLTAEGEFEICHNCGWEDDEYSRWYPDLEGANPMSLNDGKIKAAKGEPIYAGYPKI